MTSSSLRLSEPKAWNFIEWVILIYLKTPLKNDTNQFQTPETVIPKNFIMSKATIMKIIICRNPL